MDSIPIPSCSVSTFAHAKVENVEGNTLENVGRDKTEVKVTLNLNSPAAGGVQADTRGQDSTAILSGSSFRAVEPIGQLVAFTGVLSTILDLLRAIFGGHAIPASMVEDINEPGNILPQLLSAHAKKYTRSMLDCSPGYPLYDPEPGNFSSEYKREGIRVGDVGIVTEYGGFDFLFNVCPSRNPSINPVDLPDHFEMLGSIEISADRSLESITRLFSSGVIRVEETVVNYECSNPEGAILELPQGAEIVKTRNKLAFKALAIRQAENWYKYAMLTRGIDAPNGSLYLITSPIKCTNWGIALFLRQSSRGDCLRFIANDSNSGNTQCSHRWEGSGSHVHKVAPTTQDNDVRNQCVFLRGYKIMLRKDLWAQFTDPKLIGTSFPAGSSSYKTGSQMTGQAGFSDRQSGPSQQSFGTSGSNAGTNRSGKQTGDNERVAAYDEPLPVSEQIIVDAESHRVFVHPSDLINAVLLEQEPDAKVALTHDDDWRDLVQENLALSMISENDRLPTIAMSYKSSLDQQGSVSLERISDATRGSDMVTETVSIERHHSPTLYPPYSNTPSCPEGPSLQEAEQRLVELSEFTDNAKQHVRKDAQELVDIGASERLHIVPFHISREDPHHRSLSGAYSSVPSRSIVAIMYIEATQRVLRVLFGHVTQGSTSMKFVKNGSEGKLVEEYTDHLIETIRSIIEKDGPGVLPALRDQSKNLQRELCEARKQLSNADNNSVDVETISLDIVSVLRLFLFVNHMNEHIPYTIAVEEIKRPTVETLQFAEAGGPGKLFKHLPRAMAAYNDYVSSYQRRVLCFKGTRKALLTEMGEWVAKAETKIFALFGLAGIGKSTIAQTVAERADNVGLLGASFFFSRDEADRKTAERFFTTIAFQLCRYDREFASAIENVLMTEQGSRAVTKHPLTQLEILILEPLSKLAPRRVLIVVDALDECEAEDGLTIFKGLEKLVQSLPLFKVLLTTRPQQHLQPLLDGEGSQKAFHLHNIEDRVVDGDIRLYLKHYLSREAVRDHFRDPTEEWNASDDEIESLVKAAGRLFIIAAMSILFILDKAVHNPARRMEQLLNAIADDKTPFEALNNFYMVILRSALPKGCDPHDVLRFQSVVGGIILIQTPLPVEQLAKLIGYKTTDIRRVLGRLQSVILIDNNDVPHIYHKSFSGYVQDPALCKDEDLFIDLKSRHTEMAVNCFRIINQRLHQNIFGLGDHARFMDNAVLRQVSITPDRFAETLTFELCYACTCWASHVMGSYTEDQALVVSLETFVNEHLLHWFEALSWIGRLGSAHHALLIVQKQLEPTSDLGQLVFDGIRFIARFYEIIERSALHTYHSALPFTPTKTSLYKRYSKQMTLCLVQDGIEGWDAPITNISAGSNAAYRIVFSPNSKLIACHSVGNHGKSMNIYDAVVGVYLGGIGEGVTAISKDFSKATVADGSSIVLYNVKGVTPVATIKPSGAVLDLEHSPDGSRLVVGLKDGTIGLWDAEKSQLIVSLGEWEARSGIAYSSDGNRIAFVSPGGTVRLFDGKSGKIVDDLVSPMSQEVILMFSGDGYYLACMSAKTLRLWRSKNGQLIQEVIVTGGKLAISTDGTLIATGRLSRLEIWDLWNVVPFASPRSFINLEGPFNPGSGWEISSIAISKNRLIGIAYRDLVTLYDINRGTFIARLPFNNPVALVFSPDCTRIAAGNVSGNVRLWHMPNITASYDASQGRSSTPTRIALSPDCSLLASGHEDGAIKLYDTSNLTEPIAVRNSHWKPVTALAFSIDGMDFASGSGEGTILLWKNKNWMGRIGAQSGSLKCRTGIEAVALSSGMLAGATETGITLWDLGTHAIIATFGGFRAELLALSHHNLLLGVATAHNSMELWHIGSNTRIAYFDCSSIIGMTFSPDCSRLAVQCDTDLRLFSIHDNKVAENEDLSRLDICTHWHGLLVWLQEGNVVTRFPQQAETVTVLYKPSGLDVKVWAMGSSMIALCCKDGRVLLIKDI